MEQKKKIKITLGTAICLVIIVILSVALVGTIIYNNKENEEINLKNETIEEKSDEKPNLENTEAVEETTNKMQAESINKEVTAQENKTYVYSTSNKYIAGSMSFPKITFIDDNFIINIANFSVNGKYNVIEENIELKIENYSIDDNEKNSVKDNNWKINLKNVNDNKIKVESTNIEGGSEIANALNMYIGVDSEFISYNIEDFVGTWNSENAYLYEDEEWNEVESLIEIFGTSMHQYGSKFTINEDGTFEDYAFPVTEGDSYRNGTYSFDNTNELTLKYTDGDKNVTIYIINENEMIYDDGYYRIFLKK